MFGEVFAEKSTTQHMSVKTEIVLKKKAPGEWKTLEQAGADTTQEYDPKKYPSSSKNNVNWSELEKQGKEVEKDEGDPLNKLFQQIYSQGDEDTRRAMMKSFQESNGTVLSTNWKDVGAKKVKGEAPNGMEAKKWNE